MSKNKLEKIKELYNERDELFLQNTEIIFEELYDVLVAISEYIKFKHEFLDQCELIWEDTALLNDKLIQFFGHMFHPNDPNNKVKVIVTLPYILIEEQDPEKIQEFMNHTFTDDLIDELVSELINEPNLGDVFMESSNFIENEIGEHIDDNKEKVVEETNLSDTSGFDLSKLSEQQIKLLKLALHGKAKK